CRAREPPSANEERWLKIFRERIDQDRPESESPVASWKSSLTIDEHLGSEEGILRREHRQFRNNFTKDRSLPTRRHLLSGRHCSPAIECVVVVVWRVDRWPL